MRNAEPIWPDELPVPSDRNGQLFRRPDGREYVFSSSLLMSREGEQLSDHRSALTRYIDEHPEEQPVIFTTENVPPLFRRPPIAYRERLDRFARALAGMVGNRPGTIRLTWSTPNSGEFGLARAAYADSLAEARQFSIYLGETGVFDLGPKYVNGDVDLGLSIGGLLKLEEESEQTQSSAAFVAMWFSSEMTAAYDEAIAPAIEAAGFIPDRIDRREHNNKIDDEIIAGIRRAKFVVADFSCGEDGARGGVYYEAGFASGLGKPVVYLVREQDLEKVHFDTRQFNHIVWRDVNHLRTALEARIRATIPA